jgi:hypothetical protein
MTPFSVLLHTTAESVARRLQPVHVGNWFDKVSSMFHPGGSAFRRSGIDVSRSQFSRDISIRQEARGLLPAPALTSVGGGDAGMEPNIGESYEASLLTRPRFHRCVRCT